MVEAIDNKSYSSASERGWLVRYAIALVTVLLGWVIRALLSPALPSSESVYI